MSATSADRQSGAASAGSSNEYIAGIDRQRQRQEAIRRILDRHCNAPIRSDAEIAASRREGRPCSPPYEGHFTPRSSQPFATVETEGLLLPPELIARVADLDPKLPGIRPEGYKLPKGECINEATNRSWNRLTALWGRFRKELEGLSKRDAATGLTVRSVPAAAPDHRRRARPV